MRSPSTINPWVFKHPSHLFSLAASRPSRPLGQGLLTPGRWAHLAATVTQGGIRLYFNGFVWRRTTPQFRQVFLALPVPDGWTESVEDNGYFRGGLDDVCLWDGVLTDED